VCPWCYIATARFDKALAAFPHREEVEVVHRSFELDPGHDRKHVEPVPAFLARRYGPQGPDMDQQIARVARREGLEYRTDRIVGSTLDAHRLLHLAKDHGLQHELLALLFRANFARAESIFTRDALHELAAEAGLDPGQVRSVLGDPNAYLAEVRADEQEAARRGASGVPYFLLDDGHPLSGAQPVSAFTKALLQAWEDRAAQDEAEAKEFAGAVCGPTAPAPHPECTARREFAAQDRVTGWSLSLPGLPVRAGPGGQPSGCRRR
jgi:predicted DsbA family dithiol-disulfide isomerase